jgi:hypothetical protein
VPPASSAQDQHSAAAADSASGSDAAAADDDESRQPDESEPESEAEPAEPGPATTTEIYRGSEDAWVSRLAAAAPPLRPAARGGGASEGDGSEEARFVAPRSWQTVSAAPSGGGAWGAAARPRPSILLRPTSHTGWACIVCSARLD